MLLKHPEITERTLLLEAVKTAADEVMTEAIRHCQRAVVYEHFGQAAEPVERSSFQLSARTS